MGQTFQGIPVSTVAIVLGILSIIVGIFAYAPICTAGGACSQPNLRSALVYILPGILFIGGGLVFRRR